ncbi:ABC transporter ATP-binding protein [Candidatus Amarobacter glycogenicus]|uniref:ABC transporter ATP-binding protein n=1 Tax=Candidatus Amarobacter glycogenicus TaxID=3140699 RepID=UPI0031CCA2BD
MAAWSRAPRSASPLTSAPLAWSSRDYALFPNRTVAANIAYGLPRGSAARVPNSSGVANSEGLGGRYPHQLSGGQQQRVAVLRSLAPHPRILLLDEPFSNLDAALRLAMREELVTILRAEGMTAVLVTHDRTDAMAAADRIAVADAGRVIRAATPLDLYMRPSSKVRHLRPPMRSSSPVSRMATPRRRRSVRCDCRCHFAAGARSSSGQSGSE